VVQSARLVRQKSSIQQPESSIGFESPKLCFQTLTAFCQEKARGGSYSMNFLVVDCGTSGCRAAVVSETGDILSQSRRQMRIDQPRPTFAEVDTDRLWHLVQTVISAEVEKHPGITFDAVGVSAMLGYVFLDRAGRPLMPAVIYADNRAADEAEEIRQLFTEKRYLAITGRLPSPLLLAPKIKWLATHRPAVTEKLSHIIGLKDDIVRRLTGNIQTDVAHLDYSGLYNVYRGKLEADILDALDIKKTLLPDAVPATAIAGTVGAEAAGQMGLTFGVPVISGSSDGTTAMYGAGVLEEGNAVLISGTTDVLMIGAAAAPGDGGRALSVNTGFLPGTYLVGGPLGLSGGTLQYFAQLLQASVSGLAEKIGTLPPGSNGLLVLPGLSGERAPYWRPHLTGAVAGLTPDHKSEHLLRAVMEGCALRILSLLNVFAQNRLQPRTLNIAGGGAGIDVWNQIRSDACGLEVRKLAVSEATCLGTALFCKAGLDPTRSLQQVAAEWIKVARRFIPDEKSTRIYQKLARLFEAFIQTNTDLSQGLSELRSSV
jgi:sugar (pentulose or hexulose) kinase